LPDRVAIPMAELVARVALGAASNMAAGMAAEGRIREDFRKPLHLVRADRADGLALLPLASSWYMAASIYTSG